MKKYLMTLLFFITSISFSLTTITYNPSGIKTLEVTHWNEKTSIINQKETVFNENNQVLLFLDSKQYVENEVVEEIKIKRKLLHNFSTEYEVYSYTGNDYILQGQKDTVIIPAVSADIELINSHEKIKRMISEKTEKFNYSDFDALSGEQLNWLYEYNGESLIETEIGKISCINYRVTLIEGNFSTILSFDKRGEIIIGNFMGSNTYNLEYFPSKGIEKELLNFDTHRIPEYIFGNNYWKEGTAEQIMGYVKASSINMIRWGGIYRDHMPRTPEEIKRFKKFTDYTSVEPFIQLEYFSEKSALEQFNELINFFPSLKYLSFSNEANIYPSIMNKNVPLEEFIKTYKEEITALKEQYPEVKVVGPDFTISSYPQYDKWLTEFIKNNGDLIDILSLHYYPFDGSQSKERTLQNVKDFEKYIEQVKELL
ncbi:MAG: GH39 family glycosyl hydrolase, partial [Elusimicrobiota bacterium]